MASFSKVLAASASSSSSKGHTQSPSLPVQPPDTDFSAVTLRAEDTDGRAHKVQPTNLGDPLYIVTNQKAEEGNSKKGKRFLRNILGGKTR